MARGHDQEGGGRPKRTAGYQRRDVRRLAMQVLYQIDLSGVADAATLVGGIDEEVGPLELRREATELALAAWEGRGEADRLAVELAPDWPTHRQPPVDRAIIRLAHYEMVSGHAPAKVAINEAVELAKAFCAENAPAFVNGVLDKMIKRVEPGEAATEGTQEPPAVE